MKFPWFHRKPPKPSKEAELSHNSAIDAIAHIDSRWDEVREVTEELRRIRTQNHFAEQIENIFHPPPLPPRPTPRHR